MTNMVRSCQKTLLPTVAVFAYCLFPLRAQPAQTLKDAVESSAKTVLGACGPWPPKIAKTPDDQKTGKHLQDNADLITTTLLGKLNFKASIEPTEYDASFLRLLDTVRTTDAPFSPGTLPDQLLNVALDADVNQMNLWGTDLRTVNYDCMSMLGLMAQAGGGSTLIPFVSLNGAFQTSLNSSQNLTSTFIYGQFASPFVTFLSSNATQRQRTFAAMRAIEWRLNHQPPERSIQQALPFFQ
jgi:hypothetical protein